MTGVMVKGRAVHCSLQMHASCHEVWLYLLLLLALCAIGFTLLALCCWLYVLLALSADMHAVNEICVTSAHACS